FFMMKLYVMASNGYLPTLVFSPEQGFNIVLNGRGTVVATGRVEQGVIKVGEEIKIMGLMQIMATVHDHQEAGTLSSIIDPRLGNSFTAEGMEEYIQLIVRCVEVSSERRPTMSYIVTELDRILEKEMSLTTIMGEGTPVVTLGSQLFRAAK
ncbi:nodulation receptor kinase, partial [Tanacetum coccineum]